MPLRLAPSFPSGLVPPCGPAGQRREGWPDAVLKLSIDQLWGSSRSLRCHPASPSDCDLLASCPLPLGPAAAGSGYRPPVPPSWSWPWRPASCLRRLWSWPAPGEMPACPLVSALATVPAVSCEADVVDGVSASRRPGHLASRTLGPCSPAIPGPCFLSRNCPDAAAWPASVLEAQGPGAAQASIYFGGIHGSRSTCKPVHFGPTG